MVDHVLDNSFEIIDGVDTEICDQVLLSFPLLPGSEDSLEPCTKGSKHKTKNPAQEELTGENIFNPPRHGPTPLNCHATFLARLPPQQSNLSRHRTWSFAHSCSHACCPCQSRYENHALTFATRHTANSSAPFGRPIKFTFREFTSSGGGRVAPEGPAPHRPSAAPFLRMEASMFKNGSGIELKNGSGIEPSDIDTRQIVPQEASAAATFEEQLDRHANIITRFGSDWADRLVEEADRLVEEAEAKRRAAIEFAEEIKRRASET